MLMLLYISGGIRTDLDISGQYVNRASLHALADRIVSCHIISYRVIVSCRNALYLIVSHRIASYRIVSHRIVSSRARRCPQDRMRPLDAAAACDAAECVQALVAVGAATGAPEADAQARWLAGSTGIRSAPHWRHSDSIRVPLAPLGFDALPPGATRIRSTSHWRHSDSMPSPLAPLEVPPA